MIKLPFTEQGTVCQMRNGSIDAIEKVELVDGSCAVMFESGNFLTYDQNGLSKYDCAYDIVGMTVQKNYVEKAFPDSEPLDVLPKALVHSVLSIIEKLER